MTIIRGRDYDSSLADATELLIRELHCDVSAREIISAVVHARIQVREEYEQTLLDPPPPDEYVALVIGLARQALERKLLPTSPRNAPVAF